MTLAGTSGAKILGEAVHQETAARKVHRAAVWLCALTSLGWLGLSLMCLAMGFESSEYERSSARWWHDMSSCVPIWTAFAAFTSASAISLYYRRSGVALLVAVISFAVMCAFLSGQPTSLFN